jgi:hypothetical protein
MKSVKEYRALAGECLRLAAITDDANWARERSGVADASPPRCRVLR